MCALAILALVEVRLAGPPVSVRWRPGISAGERAALERQFELRNGAPDEDSPSTWEYELGNRSRENVAGLIADPAAEDTHNIDRDTMAVARPTLRVRLRLPDDFPFPFSTTNAFPGPRHLFQIQSACLLLAGGLVLWAAGLANPRRRRNVAVGALLAVAALAWALPISPSYVRMSDANQHISTRGSFEEYAGVYGVRFEAHLTAAILGQIDRVLGRSDQSPARAQAMLMRAAAIWFALCGLAVGVIERWSAVSVRYIALALVAPAALMYFGWREFGYLSLNVAAYPLVARGVRDGTWHLEAGSLLCGIGAALHGWGLVALAGALAAAAVTPAGLAARGAHVLRVAAWGTASYVGWVAIYVIVLKFRIAIGHTEAIPWRPLFTDSIFDGRLNVAIFTRPGLRDVFMQAWVVGLPLLAIAASQWRRFPADVRTALAYALPAVLMTVMVFHTQGLHEDMDVVFAIFPGFYALAWVCALEMRGTALAAAVLVSGHVAFWRIVLDGNFRSIALG